MTGVDWVDWAIGIIGALAAAWLALATGRKALADARKTGSPAEPAPPSWPEMWARMDEQERKMTELQSHVDDLRENEGRLVTWIMTLHNGIQNGTIPPLPPMPHWLERLMHRDRR